jgi:transposase InsO family protein
MAVATFRFGVIADFVTGVRLAYGEREKLLGEKTTRTYAIPGSTKTTVSRATIMLWIKLYKEGGRQLDSLRPKRRSDRGTYKGLDQTLRTAIRELKAENPAMTLPVIINKLRHRHVIAPGDKLNTATIYRFMRQEKLSEGEAKPVDRRRFEAAFPNEIWQCDVMHGPLARAAATDAKRKAYLCAIMDDHSRLVVHAEFYLAETFASLKDALRRAIERRGIPQRFYVDNGACYRSTNLDQILAGLGVQLIHSRPYTPQGRGKIERWFRTVRDDFLAQSGEGGQTLVALNERLAAWVETYNERVHSSTGQSPAARFKANLACVRPSPPDLLRHFRLTESRRVKKDRSIMLGGRLFEAPPKLIDRSVELRFHPESPLEVEIFHDGLSYGMATVLDARINARIRRDVAAVPPTPGRDAAPPPPQSSPSEVKGGQLFGGRRIQDEMEIF